MAANTLRGVLAGKGGGSVAKPMIEASGLGEKFRVGSGRISYGVFSFSFKLMK
jgi:hypothetical protein